MFYVFCCNTTLTHSETYVRSSRLLNGFIEQKNHSSMAKLKVRVVKQQWLLSIFMQLHSLTFCFCPQIHVIEAYTFRKIECKFVMFLIYFNKWSKTIWVWVLRRITCRRESVTAMKNLWKSKQQFSLCKWCRNIHKFFYTQVSSCVFLHLFQIDWIKTLNEICFWCDSEYSLCTCIVDSDLFCMWRRERKSRITQLKAFFCDFSLWLVLH